jgi:hypothetical protein
MFDALQQGATLEAAAHESVCWKKDAAPPPDYTPVAEASAESARIMADLGYSQLDFAKQQYAEIAPFSRDYLQQQMDISEATAKQGQEYYDYMKQFRPVEQQMIQEALQEPAYITRMRDYAKTITADPNQIYAQNRQAVEDQVGRAVSDVSSGFTRGLGQIGRAGLRYGLSGSALASQAANVGIAQAQQQAAAANAARTGAIADVRQRAQAGYGLEQGMGTLDWARKLDVSGISRGLPGASAGAYALAGTSGMQGLQGGSMAGQQYMANSGQAASTIGSGQQMQLGGLSNILQSQTSVYNTAQSQADPLVTLGAAWLGGGMPGVSDRRLKENVEWVGRDDLTGLALYEFNYLGDPDHRYRGVMADEVEKTIPEAVFTMDDGYKAVRYDMIGIEMVEVQNG